MVHILDCYRNCVKMANETENKFSIYLHTDVRKRKKLCISFLKSWGGWTKMIFLQLGCFNNCLQRSKETGLSRSLYQNDTKNSSRKCVIFLKCVQTALVRFLMIFKSIREYALLAVIFLMHFRVVLCLAKKCILRYCYMLCVVFE